MSIDNKAVSYCVGMSLGESLKQQNLSNLDLEQLKEGIEAIFKGEAKYSPEAANKIIQEFLTAESQKKYAKNKKEGEKFLSENAKKENVKTLPSGLQYEVLVEGDGEKPSKDNQVTVHYEGRLIDGTVFDSSVKRGEPATFGVSQVIPGWTEALQMMPKGSKYRLYIPEHLAYGATPHPGGPIEPYSTLVFDVELLDVKK